MVFKFIKNNFIFHMNTPLLLLIYNRPKETQILITRLKKFKPKYLYIFSDGPKKIKKTMI